MNTSYNTEFSDFNRAQAAFNELLDILHAPAQERASLQLKPPSSSPLAALKSYIAQAEAEDEAEERERLAKIDAQLAHKNAQALGLKSLISYLVH